MNKVKNHGLARIKEHSAFLSSATQKEAVSPIFVALRVKSIYDAAMLYYPEQMAKVFMVMCQVSEARRRAGFCQSPNCEEKVSAGQEFCSACCKENESNRRLAGQIFSES